MSYPIIMHINYCEQGQTIEEICRFAAKAGFDGIEFRAKRLHSHPDESLTAYLDDVKRYTEYYGIPYVLFGSPGIDAMSQDKAKVQASIDAYKEWLDEASKRINLTVLNFFTGSLTDPNQPMNALSYGLHGSFCAQDWHWEVAAEACQQVADYAKPLGCKFAFETHMNYLHDIAESARKLCDLIDRDNFGINLDYGNSIYFKGIAPLAKAIDICGDKLFYTHLKNSLPVPGGRLPTALGEGEVNHRAYIKKLNEVKFNGLVGIEAPRPGDREYYAKVDLAYIKSVISDLT